MSLALATGCVDYGFQTPGDAKASKSDTATPEQPPPEELDECPDGSMATLAGGVYAYSWDPTEMSGTLDAEASGWYHLYDFALSESGDSQWNESAYLRVHNGGNSNGQPKWANCEADWVQVDSDNYGAPSSGTRSYLGTFWLDAGSNSFTFHHYCPLFRDGLCTDLHNTDDSASTCDAGNWNSVHFEGEGICIVLAE
jgi:hypothetical protein